MKNLYSDNLLVTVILPTFNRANMLSRAIKSVLDQEYKDIELIVVDDASKDNTREVVGSFVDSRVKYICLEENSGGAATPRNVGLKRFAPSLRVTWATLPSTCQSNKAMVCILLNGIAGLNHAAPTAGTRGHYGMIRRGPSTGPNNKGASLRSAPCESCVRRFYQPQVPEDPQPEHPPPPLLN